MFNKLSMKNMTYKGEVVLMRVDFNVPFNKNGEIADASRISAHLPSIRYVLNQGGSLILMSHLGRPKGKKDPTLSLAPCAKKLEELLGLEVTMANDCIGKEVEMLVKKLKAKDVLMLENLRFHEAEEHPEKDPEFAKKLASLGTIYIDDAFSASHRAHASIYELPKLFPKKATAGLLLEEEVIFLTKALKDPERPFYALIGGAKISTKIGAIESLVSKVDGLLIGGGMAFTFLKAEGVEIGSSIFEKDYLEVAKKIIDKCQARKITLLLPIDQIVVDRIEEGASAKVIDLKKEGIQEGFSGVDIGPKTIQLFSETLKKAKTIFWNGPMGVFEIPDFAKGTGEMGKNITDLNAVKIVGGGDSIAALQQENLLHKMTHVSTGGGATLEFIEFGTLPGIEVLTNA